MTDTAVTDVPTGTLRTESGARAAVRFERLYDATPEELWAALTEPEQLRGWLAHASRFELEPGGAIELRFDADDGRLTHGRVRELVAGRVLEWDWDHDGEQRSVVRFELVPRDAGCLLVLDHRLLDHEDAPGYGAGWQGHLEALEALLRDDAPVDHHGRYHALRPRWAAQQAELARGVGILRPHGDARALLFERRLGAGPERVWRAITDRDQLARWLTDVTIEPRLGGDVLIDFGEAGSNPGTVLTWEPPRVLEYSWIWAGVHDSVLRFDLRPDGDGTHLRMEHRALALSVAGDHGSGWHAYLDALADVVEGRSVGSWDEREEAARPEYEAKAAALP
jgi:uncharacterized protein YndB with AHSA1/START domain